ncbi:MAG: tRNA (adenosine(37)-N6)-threonylcarbamoyltransferase complex dimerization subunit type 1 TsaB [Saprospiraceae bacterium]|nr:tRNA (adenosine(37)-N6)-threonylcarbamoyltransferase complex dimerization subunit type 1 TsaB [Saprospiraceae bacterium]
MPSFINKDKPIIRILQLEAGPPGCSVAIGENGKILGEALCDEKDPIAAFPALIRQCLHDHQMTKDQLNAISVNSGPGSYTALRSGLAFAKGLCEILDLKLISVSHLEILATAGLASVQKTQTVPEQIGVVMHTRRNEFVGSVFDTHLYKISDLIKGDTENAEFWTNQSALICSETDLEFFQSFLKVPAIPLIYTRPTAGSQSKLAFQRYVQENFCDLIHFSPYYLFEPHITTPRPKIAK